MSCTSWQISSSLFNFHTQYAARFSPCLREVVCLCEFTLFRHAFPLFAVVAVVAAAINMQPLPTLGAQCSSTCRSPPPAEFSSAFSQAFSQFPFPPPCATTAVPFCVLCHHLAACRRLERVNCYFVGQSSCSPMKSRHTHFPPVYWQDLQDHQDSHSARCVLAVAIV